MKAEIGSGLPTPVCWASMFMVSWSCVCVYVGATMPTGVGCPVCRGLGMEGSSCSPWEPGRMAWKVVGRLGGGGAEARPLWLGVWPDGSDGTDINSLCRSHNERVVAVADDFCKVHLFQYPCARAKVRRGHPGVAGLAVQDWVGGFLRHAVPPSLHHCTPLFHPGTEPRVWGPRQPCNQCPLHPR